MYNINDVKTQTTFEYDKEGQIMTIQAKVPYDTFLCFAYPKSCGDCPYEWYERCGKGKITEEDYKRRPSNCKLKKITITID